MPLLSSSSSRMISPELCLLRFVVYDVDMFGEPNFLGQYTVPVSCTLNGVRSVPLKNGFSEDLELSGEYMYVLSRTNQLIVSANKAQIRSHQDGLHTYFAYVRPHYPPSPR